MLVPKISLEVLMIGAKTELVKLTKDYVRDMRSTWPEYPIVTDSSVLHAKWKTINQKFIKDFKAIVGINIEVDLYSNIGLYAGVMSRIVFNGHSGSRYYEDKTFKVISDNTTSLRDVLVVDLQKVKVSGRLADLLKFNLIYSEELLFSKNLFTDDEIAASLIHEFGHMFNTFMTLGDYVWLNYYLTDGIEVLLGTKRNIMKIEILTPKWLEDNLSKDEIENFTNNRNEESAKRVILSALKMAPRHHLMDNRLIANKREEQLADLFAVRLGMGKQLASFGYKFDRHHGEFNQSRNNWLGEIAKLMCSVVLLPVAVVAVIMYDPIDLNPSDAKYDNPIERLLKVKRDLINQLKSNKGIGKESLVADIEAIELIIKEYSVKRDIFDPIIEFLRPDIRKQKQHSKLEEDLESLLNNDLFIQAFKLSKI